MSKVSSIDPSFFLVITLGLMKQSLSHFSISSMWPSVSNLFNSAFNDDNKGRGTLLHFAWTGLNGG